MGRSGSCGTHIQIRVQGLRACRSGVYVFKAYDVGQNCGAEEGYADTDDISHELAKAGSLSIVGHDGQDTVVGKACVYRVSDTHNGAAGSACDNRADHRLLQAEVTAVNRRLCDTYQPCGKGGGSSYLL